MSYFTAIESIPYQGVNNQDELAYRYYNPQQLVLGKTMAEQLRLAVCYWHSFCWQGNDPFGGPTRNLPWQASDALQQAENKLAAAFEFFSKLNVPFFSFHDTDLAPAGDNPQDYVNNLKHMVELTAKQMAKHKIKLLWGTANLFSHPRYQAGAATNPDPEIFSYGALQVKQALEATHQLQGANYVLWGGREGYDTLLNTDLRQELNQLGRFLSLVAEHKHKIGFTGQLLIEPKPCEPTKHQYDFDSATVYALLQKFNLEQEFKVNIEANHATLAGHSFEHEVSYALANDLLGSIDINRGDYQNGWDTDQFPNSVEEMTGVIYQLVKHGGWQQGGFNFDAKVRRQSTDLTDMFYGHVGAIDVLAKALLNAERLIKEQTLEQLKQQRYKGWQQPLGQDISEGKHSLASLADKVLTENNEPQPRSGQQERLENLINRYIH
jgi:xylose isomerase